MFDFCINGAGMVGAATALGLAQQGYQVAIIEQRPPQPFNVQQPPDLRMSAISVASVDLLKALGAWQHIETMRLRSYSKLSVWEHPDCRTDFDAKDAGFDRLGYFVENRLIQLGCHQALKAFDNVSWFSPAHIASFTRSNNADDTVSVTLENGETLQTKWLIGADGAESQVRQLAGIGISGWQYAQQAMGIIVEFTQPVTDCTWQQFTADGPKALLPMHDNFASLIWYDSAARLAGLSRLSSAQLKQAIITDFPPLDDDFTVLNKAAFTLIRRHASDYVIPGVILVGDAAHTINPLAGQGVNLGFKDVACLLQQTAHQQAYSDDFLSQLQSGYERPRKRDNRLMMSAMDGFYTAFSNNHAPLKWLRNGLLKLAQHTGPLKHQVLKYAMGLA
ncbi:FAD-dependent monooxygenase [Alteromonas lipolytica]|uniref:2-octaprenyl-3-methyl-6-methoxy-1,4-benzoquinol hydroxylase n=1 Tax=Alteromonas lipolytica TaxID=1856405 RepID=A0A1E8FGT5_9ALTE|nr:FAD-dependent monooxygenase [Alteromonas lipolytica]OFI34673.1 2-octaprenyl-3-methyl-6-methoxy-1,4-benzoquinol hydroxylase [Alteromonas lipolytica]GGF53058.1 2-octaprenyl-3-methyl-6-methoxy-1,4-benzoquinol hydroxylase [Alteromonas lipolytica]